MPTAAQIAAKVLDAITRVGVDAVFTIRAGDAAYNPSTGLVTESAGTTVTARVSPPLSFAQFYKTQDTPAKAGTSVLVLSSHGLTFVPTVGMKLSVAGRVWSIGRVTAHQFQSTVVAYELEISSG